MMTNSSFTERGRRKAQVYPQNDVVPDHDMNRNRPSRRGMKGFTTIFFITFIFCVVWTPTVILYIAPLQPEVVNILDILSGCYTWLEPIIFLLTSSEARRIVFGSFPPRCFKTDRLHKRQLKILGEVNAHNRPIQMQSLKTEGSLLTHDLTFSKPSPCMLGSSTKKCSRTFVETLALLSESIVQTL